jgi:hypothetical protein
LTLHHALAKLFTNGLILLVVLLLLELLDMLNAYLLAVAVVVEHAQIMAAAAVLEV